MWVYLFAFVISAAASYFLAPRPKGAPPPSVGEIKAPTAEEGREIPVLFGTRDIKGANVVWYGDIRTSAIKKKGGKK